MTREEFIESLLTGLTAPPAYFPKNVLMNIQGYESLDSILNKANTPLNPEAFEMLANETRALVLDTRDAEDFAKGFIPNSINIGLTGNFAMWVGEMITDIKQEILLVTEKGKEEEAMIRLSRVGYDNTIAYLEGGFDAWKSAGKDFETVKRIDATEFEKEYKNKPLVIDVRKKSEFDSEHVLGAVNVPLNEINQHLAVFPKNEPFIIHCAGGYRSMIASAILKQRGWDNFSDVRGGFDAIKLTETPKTEYVCPTTLL
jgi:rhodanese-related sulfurtransferase